MICTLDKGGGLRGRFSTVIMEWNEKGYTLIYQNNTSTNYKPS